MKTHRILRTRRAFVAGSGALVSQLVLGCRGDAGPTTPPRSTELWLGGDLHVGDADLDLSAVQAMTAGAVGIVNLEGPVSDTPTPPFEPGKTVTLSNARRSLRSLVRAGIGVVGIANNHALDRGAAGLETTAREVEAAGLLAAGGPKGAVVLARESMSVAVAAFDLPVASARHIEDALTVARSAADVLVCTFHVTGPPSYLPELALRAAVDVALTAGASVVAAHGTHALAPVERRGSQVIAWGLGNLAFACNCTEEIDGAILRVAIRPDRVDARVFPIDAGLHGKSPRPSHDPKLILDLLAALGSSPLTRDDSSASF